MGLRDGHDFAAKAATEGAAAIIIDLNHLPIKESLPQTAVLIAVPDTLKALGDLAHAWRQQFSIPLVALTGSNGKTTTKEFIRAILATRHKVLATEGNFNNLIGVPKTLFRLSAEDEIAVIEMGMNDFNEIHRLAEIANPSLGLITNIAPAHLEKLGDVTGVTRAKGELFAWLGSEDVAIINLNDPNVASLPTQAQKIPVGTEGSSLWGEILPNDPNDPHPLRMKIHGEAQDFELSLKIPGAHNLENILLALAVGHYFKVPWEAAKKALESFTGAPSRMELVPLNQGKHLLDDCYNANPISTTAALKTLAQLKGAKKAVAILGDMNELGAYTQEGHELVGKETAKQDINFLVAIGIHREKILAGAREEGMIDQQLSSFPNVQDASKNLDWFPKEVEWILVKGSRTTHLEVLAKAIKDQF